MQTIHCAIGVDVGTNSVRAGIVEIETGKLLHYAEKPISVFEYSKNGVQYLEQDSQQIFDRCKEVIKIIVSEVDKQKYEIVGIGFDATCSLVVSEIDPETKVEQQFAVGPSGSPNQNVILWADHRAVKEAEWINLSKFENVLKYVGNRISPEMQIPKLKWLNTYRKTTSTNLHHFDLADYLTFRFTGKLVQSECTNVCKWNYLCHEQRFDYSYMKSVGVSWKPKDIRQIGSSIEGGIPADLAEELGLKPNLKVGVSMIDAHAGTLGSMFSKQGGEELKDVICKRLVIVAGTSACFMSMTKKPVFINGIWGPFYNAIIPGYWVNEGGISACGRLIDYIIQSHPYYPSLKEQKNIYHQLHNTLLEMEEQLEMKLDYLTKDIHIYPDFHGNRSPLANPNMKGAVIGLTFDTASIENLALMYLAAIQALAYQTRHIIQKTNKKRKEQGEQLIETIFMCGGLSKNQLFLSQVSQICQCDIIVPKENESMIIGSAALGAMAHYNDELGGNTDIFEILGKMNSAGDVVHSNKSSPRLIQYHNIKYEMYRQMYKQQLRTQAAMASLFQQ